MSPADQVAENIYQLRNLRLIFAYWTDGSSSQYPVFPVDVRDSRDVPTPVHRLIDLGNAAVPQLIDALDDRTFTRTMVPSFNGRDLPHAMRVSDFARNILEFMSGRIPGGKMTREQAEAWWADVQSKGESEKQQLIDRAVVGGGTGSLNAAHKLVEKYPDAAIDAIAAGIRTTSNEGVRGAYVEIAGTLPGDASLAFLRSKLTPDVGVPSQIAAARALFARGQPEALPAMIDAWRGIQSRLPIDGWDFDWAAGGLITFLARSGDAGAIDALGHDLRRAPVDVRLAVVEVFLPHRPSAGSTGPSVQVYADMTTLPAGAAGAAIERLLVASLDDRERRLSMNGTYDEAIFTDPRVCDMAALTLSKRWPEKYTFHWSADAADCDAQIDKIRAKWIRESSVTLRTSGFELQT
jgi:hypothetical protein